MGGQDAAVVNVVLFPSNLSGLQQPTVGRELLVNPTARKGVRESAPLLRIIE